MFRLSCATGDGLDELPARAVRARARAGAGASAREDELADFLVYRPQPKARAWRLLRTDRGFRVARHAAAEEELERALRAAGAQATARGRGRRRGASSSPEPWALGSSAARSTRRTTVTSSSLRAGEGSELGLDRAGRARRRRPGAQARSRRPPTCASGSRAPRSPTTRCVLDEHARTVDTAARASRVARAGLPRRRRRVLRLPGVEGAGRGAASSPGSASRRGRASRASDSTPCWPSSRTRSACCSSSSSRCPSPRRAPRRLDARRGRRRATSRPAVAGRSSEPRACYDPSTAGTLSALDAHSNRHAASRRSPRTSSPATSSSSTCGPCAPTPTTSSSCTGGNPRQTKAIWDEVHGRLKQENGLLPRSVEGEPRGDVDRGRLPRRRPARLHARSARVLPARGALGRRAARDARSRHGLKRHVFWWTTSVGAPVSCCPC